MIKYIALMMLFISTANAGYVNDYADWRKVLFNQKSSYLTGVSDRLEQRFTSDGKTDSAKKVGVFKCTYDLKMTGKMLVELVDGAYQRNPDLWNMSPPVILNLALLDLCIDDINLEREKSNLEPWSTTKILK